MYLIVEQIKKRKMPMELVLLPIVESALTHTRHHPPMPQGYGRLCQVRGEIMA